MLIPSFANKKLLFNLKASGERMFAFVDETGNTGANLFDKAQPDFFTAALITKTNFDLVYRSSVASLAKKIGVEGLHAKELGLTKIEQIAGDLLKLLKKADARFFLSRVEKRYLLATKIFDTFFDSGENAAVAWHIYNVRPLRMMMAFKVATLVTVETAEQFWNVLLDTNEERQTAAIPGICQALIDQVDTLPDQASRDIVSQALVWVRDHPETVHLHNDTRQARNGHMPNMVAFANLLEGLEEFSKKWKRKVRRITHDRQSEFDKTLALWHEMHSTASDEPIHLPGETLVFQKVVGSEFEVKKSEDSAGIQAIDVVLWLYLQLTRGKLLPENCARLFNYVGKHAWINDFSFDGVRTQMERRYGEMFTSPITPEQAVEARKMLDHAERARVQSMKQYERDGVVPFMRSSALTSMDVEGDVGNNTHMVIERAEG